MLIPSEFFWIGQVHRQCSPLVTQAPCCTPTRSKPTYCPRPLAVHSPPTPSCLRRLPRSRPLTAHALLLCAAATPKHPAANHCQQQKQCIQIKVPSQCWGWFEIDGNLPGVAKDRWSFSLAKPVSASLASSWVSGTVFAMRCAPTCITNVHRITATALFTR